MRQSRMKIASAEGRAVYHCVSRIVDRRFVFGEAEKEKFVGFLREYEQFCGVQVLTFCVMSNHFHLLVEVPLRPAALPSAEEVLMRLKGLSGAAVTAAKARQLLEHFAKSNDETGAARFLEQFHRRMWDVSEFIKLLKQRFTQWYNRRTERKGTLWEDRFKSVLVEGEGDAVGAVAAYIDLNPVRAGLVSDPGRYRWSGYGEAMAGRRGASEGIRRIQALAVRFPELSRTQALRGYRMRIFVRGETGREGTDETGRPLRLGIQREAVLAMLKQRGRIGIDEYVRCRVRYFSDGVALGSRGFVEGIFGRFRGHFGARRTTGSRRMRGLEPELFAARDLRLNVFA